MKFKRSYGGDKGDIMESSGVRVIPFIYLGAKFRRPRRRHPLHHMRKRRSRHHEATLPRLLCSPIRGARSSFRCAKALT